MKKSSSPHLPLWPTEEVLLVEVSLPELLRYIARKTGRCPSLHHPEDLPGIESASLDGSLLLRQGLNCHLHLNLGIPGIADPPHPIEENAAALYAAMVLNWSSLFVILSGELEVAIEERLVTEQAISNLRNLIRVSS